jgi:Holliday junction resolvase RusA-like endonuclease
MNWRDSHKLLTTWDWEVKAAMRGTYDEIRFEHAKRRVKIISYRKKFCDVDNFIGGLKPLIDALILNHLLIDDSNKFMVLDPHQEQDLKNQRTEVIISEIKE